jgi:CheY-like chemotaxis protein
VIAVNGKEGVEIVQQRMENNEKPFDLIFMDIHMPVMDGLEAASKITAMNTGIPIIAMTANIMASERDIYREHGMPDCVGKPFTSQELWRCLLNYLTPVEHKPVNENLQKKEDDDLQNMLRMNFYKYNQTRYDEFIQALESGDAKLAHRIVHTLKSNAGQLGKTRLQNISKEIEGLLKNEDEITTEHFEILKQELNSVLEELEPFFKETEEIVPVAEFDLEKSKELVNQLKPLLKSGSPESVNFINDIRSIPGSEELVRQIDDFDFEAAIVTLAKITEEWG